MPERHPTFPPGLATVHVVRSPVRRPVPSSPGPADGGERRQREDDEPQRDERGRLHLRGQQELVVEEEVEHDTDDGERDGENAQHTRESSPVHRPGVRAADIKCQGSAPPKVGMTTVVVLADVPGEGVLSALQPEPLSAKEATALYRATLLDVCATIQHGEADLLVNYPDPERVGVGDPEGELRAVLDPELERPGDVRYEVQVGESYAGRVGNALTHLLESEGERTVGVVEPTVPLLRREHVGTVAMKLRTGDVALGPAPGGRLYFAGFREPVDFADVYAPPAVETVTDRAVEAGLAVEYLPVLPRIDDPADFATAVSLVRARASAGRIVPTRTAELVAEWGLSVAEDGTVSRGSANDSDND